VNYRFFFSFADWAHTITIHTSPGQIYFCGKNVMANLPHKHLDSIRDFEVPN